MAYTPTEWVSGTIISASKLNNIERGVESVNSEYTPTTWAEGDKVTAAKLNKIEQGIADASSDFSTAQVTISGLDADMQGCFIFDGEDASYTYGTEFYDGTYTTVLYKGMSYFYYSGEKTIAVTGSATTEGNEIHITGDCTITIVVQGR